MGHPRTAERANAHPTPTVRIDLALVHNGIIENHVELSDQLIADATRLESETRTEVLAHLIKAHLDARPNDGLASAMRAASPRCRAPSPSPSSTPATPTPSWPPAGYRRSSWE